MNSFAPLIARLAKCVILCCFLVLSCACLPAQALPAKDYSVINVTIEARLHPDGSMDVKERRTYSFRGDFHWATYVLETSGTGGVSNFALSERDRAYSKGDAEAAGTYHYEETSGRISVKWFFEARDENRTFVLSYHILDVVKRSQDAAVLYHKFIGTGWTKPTGLVEVAVYPPVPIGRDSVRAWAHGPRWGRIRTKDDGVVVARISSLPERTAWEIRCLYPPEPFFDAKTVIKDQVAPGIIAEEEGWEEETRREWREREEKRRAAMIKQAEEESLKRRELTKRRKEVGRWIVAGVSSVALLWLLALLARFGKKPKTPPLESTYSLFPSEIRPALLSQLLYPGETQAKALIATLLDLARRRYLRIREQNEDRQAVSPSHQERSYSLEFDREHYLHYRDELLDFEQSLLTFFFDDLGRGKDVVQFETLRRSKIKFSKWFKEWSKKVEKQADSEGYWDGRSVRAWSRVKAAGAVLFAASIFAALLVEEWAALPGAAGVILMALSPLIPRRSAEFQLEARRWTGFKKFLKKFHFGGPEREFYVQNIGKFTVYGLVLGLGEKLVEKVAEMIPQGERKNLLPWYVRGRPDDDLSPAAFGLALSSLVTHAAGMVGSVAGSRVGGGAGWGGGGGWSGASGGGGGGTGGSGGDAG